ETLHGEDRVERALGSESSSSLADTHHVARQERDRRRKQRGAGLGIGQHARRVAVEHCDEAGGGSQVDADDTIPQACAPPASVSPTSTSNVLRYAISDSRRFSSASTSGALGFAASHVA